MAAGKNRTGFGTLVNLFQGWSSDNKKTAEDEDLIKNAQHLDIDNADGSDIIDASYFASTDFATQDSLKQQADAINEYRAMALYPEVEWAIDDIVNALISCDSDQVPVQLNLDNVDLSDGTKAKIAEEFTYLASLMDFNNTAYERVKEWYVDGRLLFQVIVDPNKKKEGIQKLIPLDPRAVRKVTEIKKTANAQRVETITSIQKYYVYDQQFAIENTPSNSNRNRAATNFARQTQRLRIEEDGIIQVHSGLISAENNNVLSYLEYARKAMNNLKIMEDAMVIYRITRAPERRAFYIDTGSLPKKSAEEYLKGIMNRFKNRISYDATSGKVNTNAHQMTMMEDYWLPRREGGRGTEVSTLPGGQNLNDIDDVLYFLKKLYKALKVPPSRLEQDSSILIGGRGAEVTRDEWKFDKFIQRLRRRFAGLFTEMLGRHLVLKNISTEDDWNEIIKPNIQYIYTSDGYMKEQQELDTFANRIGILTSVDGFVGRYFSKETIERKVLRRSDEEIQDERKRIKDELASGLITISDPMNPGGEMDPGAGLPGQQPPANFGSDVVPSANDETDEVFTK